MAFHIETRKVQQTGGSSFIISLPKGWIEKHGIHKNDTLGILSQPDGNLLITPNINSEEVLKKKEIIVDEYKDPNYLFRVLIGAYIMGYSRLIVKSSTKFEPSMRECIISFTQIAIGPEIIEETNNVIVMKDLLNPKEMPFEKTIRRMYILAQTMHEDAIRALKTKDEKLVDEIVKRDNDIDRLHWLIDRQSHIVLRDIILCQKMGITLEDANHFQIMSRFLERIGDHAVKIAENARLTFKQDVDEDIIEKIEAASKIALELLFKSLDAWLQKDMNIANDTLESIEKLIIACEDIIVKLDTSHGAEFSIAIGYIRESIRRTGEYAGDISEIIINKLI